jgi:uncharacterized Zn finger protein
MTLPDKGPNLMWFPPAPPLPGDLMAERAGGRAWLLALVPRGQAGAAAFTRARAYARTAPVAHLTLEPGTVRCWINENPEPRNDPYAYVPQPHPTIRIPVLDASQWRDLALITRHLAGRWAHQPADDVLIEITEAGARNGIHLMPTLDRCEASCPCASRADLCKHAATALYQVARAVDAQPLALLLLAGRAPTDFFAALKDPGHPSLQRPPLPRYPVVSAHDAYASWELTTQPSLPSPLAPPPAPKPPESVAMPGTDAEAMGLLAADTAQRAHTLLLSLISSPGPAQQSAPIAPADPREDAARLAAQHPLSLPLQRRMRETLERDEDERARATIPQTRAPTPE